MRVVPNLAAEFEEICAQYSAVDQQGKDIVALVKMFGYEYDHLDDYSIPDFGGAWRTFLGEHQHQMTVPMTGQVLYLLLTYWSLGQVMYQELPQLEKMLLRDTVQEISDEIQRRSVDNGNAVEPA